MENKTEIEERYSRKSQRWGRVVLTSAAVGMLTALFSSLAGISGARTSSLINPYQTHPEVIEYNDLVREKSDIDRSIQQITSSRRNSLASRLDYQPEELQPLLDSASSVSFFDSLASKYGQIEFEVAERLDSIVENNGQVVAYVRRKNLVEKTLLWGRNGGFVFMLFSLGISIPIDSRHKRKRERELLELKEAQADSYYD